MIARADVVLLFSLGGDLTPGPRLHSDYCRPNYTRRAQFLLGSRRARNLCVWRQPRPTEGNQENEVLMTTSIVLPMQMRPTSQKGKHTHREHGSAHLAKVERKTLRVEKKTIDERERERATSTRREKNNRTCKGPGTSFSFHDRQSCSRGPSPRTARNYMAYFHISCCCLVPSLFSFQLH